MFHKNEKERCLAYSAHTACDSRGYVVAAKITAGNVHDSTMMSTLVDEIIIKLGKPDYIAADAGYKTGYNCRYLLGKEIIPAMPYTRPLGNDGEMFRPSEFVYDEYYDVYLCPQNEMLQYFRTDRDGYKMYRSQPIKCKNCPDLNKCTKAHNQQKIITRHIWKEYVEEVEHLRHTSDCRMIYKARKETIERVFADCKEKHAMRYTQLRGLGKVKEEILLTFACLNLKKMIKALSRNGKLRLSFYQNYNQKFA